MFNDTKHKLILSVLFFIILYSTSCKEVDASKISEKPVEIKFLNVNGERWGGNGHTPVDGFIKNDSVAVKVGYVILTSIYGENIDNQLPFNVYLYNDSIWILTGTLPDNMAGGVAYIEIRKSDGQVLKVAHGK